MRLFTLFTLHILCVENHLQPKFQGVIADQYMSFNKYANNVSGIELRSACPGGGVRLRVIGARRLRLLGRRGSARFAGVGTII